MAASALVDAGFLVALISRRDAFHGWAVSQAPRLPPPWKTCEAALSEASQLGRSGTRGLALMLGRGALVSSFRFADDMDAAPALGEIRRRADQFRRRVSRAHDRDIERACASDHGRRLPHLSSPRPTDHSLCPSALKTKAYEALAVFFAAAETALSHSAGAKMRKIACYGFGWSLQRSSIALPISDEEGQWPRNWPACST
jgi:hypothetical protein